MQSAALGGEPGAILDFESAIVYDEVIHIQGEMLMSAVVLN